MSKSTRSYMKTTLTSSTPSVPGDSGAWVFDPATGQLCGHVLAWSDKFHRAYIAPMQILFEDISRSLGVEASLPGTENGSAVNPLGQLEPEIDEAIIARSKRASTAPAEGRGIEISLDSLSISGGSETEQSRSFMKHITPSFQSRKGMMHMAGTLGGQMV